MANIYRSLLLVIAGATQKELARQIKYLKVENEILRTRIPGRVYVTPKERRRLVKFAMGLSAKAIKHLVSIVHPETVLRWVRESRKECKPRQKANRGRRQTPEQLRRLIRKMARENDWGYTRIMGELKKLGIKPPSRNTVKNILKQSGFDPGPKRGEGTWDDFLKRHAHSLWQCDFLSRRVVTWKGFRQVFVLAFLHVETRRVILSPATFKHDAAWAEVQANVFVNQARADGLRVARIMHDRDKMFSIAFDATLNRKRVKILRSPFCSPNINAYVERFVQSIKQECLDHFIVFGTQHMDYLCGQYLEYYHTERPHQDKENELLLRPERASPADRDDAGLPMLREVRCRSRLGGLLNSYSRRAA
ncbi:MAG: integrase core domain-containing protein [Pirellulales bacterium]|nr:integrase core domain-containing protein [Pirellulales bacterium]